MFNCLPGGGEFSIKIQLAERGVVFYAIARDEDTFFREKSRAGIPNYADGLLRKGDAAVNPIVLFPETA